MSIKQRNNKVILDTIWPDGIRTRTGMPDQKTGERLDLRIRAAKVDGTWMSLRQSLNIDKSIPVGTLSELIGRYLEEYCDSTNRRPDVKRARVKPIVRHIGSVPVSSISNLHVDSYKVRRKRDGVKPATINRELTVLYHMFTWATSRGILKINPLGEKQKLREVLWEGRRPTREAISAIFSALPAQVVPFFTFILETGCRRGEAILLKRHDVDLQRGTAIFRETKGCRPRTIMLSKEAVASINAMPEAPGCEYVFYNPVTLQRWWDCSATWQRARARAGFPWFRIHDLRGFFGIRLAESGCPMHVIQAVLGHSSVSVTEKYYAKFSPEWSGRVALAHLEKTASGY